jgi:uncharacterized phage protein (TIGR01671 family)
MREIKFRYWNWKEIEFWSFEWTCNADIIWFDIDSVELMQYTWLEDKNWKEIYEGDIVDYKWKDTQWPFPVVFDLDSPYRNPDFHLDNRTTYWLSISKNIVDFANIVVIWNIYENPELLQSKK